MRFTSTAIAAIASVAAVAACGSAPSQTKAAQGKVSCDRYGEPGQGTVQALFDQLAPGETGCLRGGAYEGTGAEGYVLVPRSGGRKGAPITIRSAPGELARLRGVVYVPDGSDRVTLSHVDIDARHPRRPESSQIGIQILGDRTTIASSRITTRANQTCLIITDGARRTALRANVFHRCGDPGNKLFDHAVYAANSRKARITGNVFARTSGWAVHLYPGARRSYVAHNLMWDNGGAVIFAGDGEYASNHNIVVDNVMGASRARPELTSSFAGPVGRGNVARGNCLSPGLLASEGEGFRLSGNRIADGPACFAQAGTQLVDKLHSVAPGLASRLAG